VSGAGTLVIYSLSTIPPKKNNLRRKRNIGYDSYEFGFYLPGPEKKNLTASPEGDPI